MRTIFTHPNPMVVQSLAIFLESRGVGVRVHGHERVGLSGLIPPLECWPEVRLLDDEQWPKAERCVAEFRASELESEAKAGWLCPRCGEQLEPQFTACWKCQWSQDEG